MDNFKSVNIDPRINRQIKEFPNLEVNDKIIMMACRNVNGSKAGGWDCLPGSLFKIPDKCCSKEKFLCIDCQKKV